MKDLRQLNKYRNIEKQKQLMPDGFRRSLAGIFEIPLNSEETASVIADNGVSSSDWEHVSVSTPTRCLTWEEMCKIKELFFNDDGAVIQIHPAKKNYVNVHNFCLHLWKPKNEKLSLPPSYLVL